MKKKLFTLMTLLLCLCSTAWAQTYTAATGGTIIEHDDLESSCNYNKSNAASISQSTTVVRTGSGAACAVLNTSSEGPYFKRLNKIAFTQNTYIHAIAWVKSPSQSYKFWIKLASTDGTKTDIGGDNNWHRLLYSSTAGQNFTSSNTTKDVAIYLTSNKVANSIYFDDIIYYYTTNNVAPDITSPTSATDASATTSTITWTNGNDATSNGYTGIQNTLIFKRTSGSAEDLALNNQGKYTVNSTDQSGHWTLVSASVAADVTSYSGTFEAGDVYAIVHRDLVYNYSTPTYVTVASNKTTPTLALGAGSGSADIADGRTAFTLPVLTSDPDVAAIKDHISYSSSATDVATIDASTGAITLKKAGETTITASFDGDDNYNEASAEYVLTVTNSKNIAVELTSDTYLTLNDNLLTAEEISNKTLVTMGINSSMERVPVNDASAIATLTGSYHSKEHGWQNFSATVDVTGPVKITFGSCAWGGNVTVKNSLNETVGTFNTDIDACYHSDKTKNIVEFYYRGEATTLTISGGSYVPYFAVEAMGVEEMPYYVSFNTTGVEDLQGTTPTKVAVLPGGDFTIPVNNSLYVADKTLKKWNDGTADRNIGYTISNISSDVTLTPVFDDNVFTLDELTAATTVNFYLNQGDGAPIMAASNGGSTMRVAQATVGEQSIDVLMNVTSTTKFNNNQGAESAQITATSEVPTTIQVPGVAGMTVTMNYDFNTSYLGSSTNTGTYSSGITTWTYDGSDNPVTLTLIASGYPSLMTVTYPAKPTCETPTITPATFNTDNQEVTISCATDGATIYYTTDGTDPTTTSDVYDANNKPTISSTTTFKAYAVKDGAFDSEVATATITRTTQVVKTWDFTNWSSATQTGVLADDTWKQYEKGGTSGIDLGSTGGRSYSGSALSSADLKYSNTTIGETEGLKFTTSDTYQIAVLFNMSSAKVGDVTYNYHGGSYIWLYKNNAKITIPNVPAGSTIEIATESHNGGTARYVTLSGVENIERTQGATSGDAAKAYQVCKWSIPSAGNILVTPSAGLHIYYIKVTQDVPTIPATVQSYGWATYIPTSNVEFADGDAYVVTDINTSTGATTVAPVTQVPANTPVLLKGEGTKNIAIINTTPAAPSTNLMEVYDGSDKGTKVPYVLAKNGESAGFKKWTGAASVITGRAVMWLDSAIATAREFFSLDDVTTGINALDNELLTIDNNAPMYNLAGQKVSKSYKGIVIVNGKKVLKK